MEHYNAPTLIERIHRSRYGTQADSIDELLTEMEAEMQG